MGLEDRFPVEEANGRPAGSRATETVSVFSSSLEPTST